jgi:hypothetical protein
MFFVERLSRYRNLACLCIVFQVFGTSALAQRQSPAPRGQAFVAQLPEQIPPPPAPATADGSSQVDCPPAPADTPLPELNVDITPRYINGDNRAGQFVPSDELPPNCATHLTTDVRSADFNLACASCQMSLCELLQLAQYCHNPLYFEERHLERYGICSCCCQPLASAACFYGNALCLPAKMWRHCPCSCVSAHPCD